MKMVSFLKRIASLLIAACLTVTAGCAAAPASDGASQQEPLAQRYIFTDSLGNEVVLPGVPQKVAALMGSYAETWLLAGGTLAAVTTDAYEERGLELPDTTASLGTLKEPDLEALLALEPDFVLLSADTDGQRKLADTLAAAQIPAAYFHVETFEEYLAMLKICTDITGRADLYAQNGLEVARAIEATIAGVQGKPAPTVLFLRAFSSGVKAKGGDNLTGVMLQDLGAINIAQAGHESLLEDLQMEEIIVADPDFILVTTMGADTQKALDKLKETVESNPAWASLTAVKNGRYLVLPKELFHYKPNARWGESYEILAEILYGGHTANAQP